MQWLELCIQTCSAGIELVGERLTVLGYDSFIVDDQAEFETFLEQNKQYWDYVDQGLQEKMEGLSQIRLYLEDNAQAMETVRHLQDELQLLRRQNPGKDLGTLEIRISNLQDEDWENNWKQYYKPIPVGEGLLVLPKWEPEPEGNTRRVLKLDPGLAFGTGGHATTRMCLEFLEGLELEGARALDLGCGSGILGIGALILGCADCTGCDIDPKSPEAAADNAALNGIAPERYHMYVGDVLSDRRLRAKLGSGYDVVLANIVSDVIIPLAPYARECVRPGGRFIASGIIEGRQDEVAAAIAAAGFEIRAHLTEDGWHAYMCE